MSINVSGILFFLVPPAYIQLSILGFGAVKRQMAYTLRFSALASSIAVPDAILPPPSLRSCFALARECVPDILYHLRPWSRPASRSNCGHGTLFVQLCALNFDAHGCANAAKTWMSKSGLTRTKKFYFQRCPLYNNWISLNFEVVLCRN